jgi:Ca-activated chloride channel homolog
MAIRFANPEYLLLFLPLALLGYWYFAGRRARGGTIRFSHLGYLKDIPQAAALNTRHWLFALRMAALASLVLAFARPQSGVKGEEVLTEGIDIVLAMDVSSTMLAEDIRPNRVDATKAVAKEFIRGRKNDRIGLVVFAGQAYTQCPLTLDYGILMNFIDQTRVGMIEDGTAVGMGLATAVNRLRSSEAKSKVIILLTDGQNNRGEVDPLTAAQMAQAFDIRVYTIGAGTRGVAMFPVEDPFFGKRYQPMQVNVDEETLEKIARTTEGDYFRATDRKSLEAIYRKIDGLEKTEIKVREYTRYSELFYYLVLGALALLLLEIGLANTRFRKIP